MTDCLFCRIVAGEIPSYTVYEDEKTRAFLDIFPSTIGHVMVIHKTHGETILDYPPQSLQELMATVQKAAKGLQDTYGTTILSIGINHGEPAGVHHLHVHIMPRFPDDGGGIIQSLVKKEVKKEDLPAIAEKIRKQMS